MRRRLFNLLSITSLLAAVAAGALWASSYRTRYALDYTRGSLVIGLMSENGHLELFLVKSLSWVGHEEGFELVKAPPQFTFTQRFAELRTSPWRRVLGPWCGFVLFLGNQDDPGQEWSAVIIPHWSLAAALTILPLLWLHRRRRRQRFPGPHQCRVCGYDLRATPERCPECGTGVG